MEKNLKNEAIKKECMSSPSKLKQSSKMVSWKDSQSAKMTKQANHAMPFICKILSGDPAIFQWHFTTTMVKNTDNIVGNAY